jgi:hypothetical protein
MQQQRRPGPKDVDKAVAELDDMRTSVFFRDPDRADGRFVRDGRRRSVDVIRAQGRLRTARWRGELDRRKAATLEQIGKALCVALATTDRLEGLTDAEGSLLGRMIVDLKERGFDVVESMKTLRKLRNRLVDPADRQGEPTATTAAPIHPSSWGPRSQPF